MVQSTHPHIEVLNSNSPCFTKAFDLHTSNLGATGLALLLFSSWSNRQNSSAFQLGKGQKKFLHTTQNCETSTRSEFITQTKALLFLRYALESKRQKKNLEWLILPFIDDRSKLSSKFISSFHMTPKFFPISFALEKKQWRRSYFILWRVSVRNSIAKGRTPSQRRNRLIKAVA